MGRRKIEIKPIRDDRNRSVTFLKRKGGLFKKAHELSVLCSVDVAVVIFGHNKKLFEYSSSDINEIVGRFQYTMQYGGAHEHKGPPDFADKSGGGDDDEDEDAGDDGGAGGEERGTPAPDPSMLHRQMQNHPGFQHVRHETPSGSPPMHNGAIQQVQRGPSPLPLGISRPSSRADQHQGHIRRTSSNLVPPHLQQSQGQPPPPSYAYTPNPPFYNPNAQPQMQGRPPVQQGHPGPYPPPYPPQYQGAPYPPPPPPPATHQQIQQAYMGDNRRSPMPPALPPPPQPPPQANMTRHPSQEHLQPPPHGRPPNRSPQPQHRPSPSPQPPQHQFASPPMPQPKPLPAHAKTHSIFTPIDDSRSMLAQHWGSTNVPDVARSDGQGKSEGGGPRPASIDVAAMQRGKETGRAHGSSPRPPPARGIPKSPPGRSASSSSVPTVRAPKRSNTNQSDAKRPRLKVQIPSEQSGDEGGTASGQDDVSTAQTASENQQQGPSHGVVLPPPSPSAGALLSAGAQGPPNPFARPAPPMSTNPHAVRDNNHIETPMSALPSRFMSDNLLPSPSTFYPEWFGRSGDSNMLPSPLNFQTPVVSNGQGWREEDRKRASDEELAGASDPKKTKT